MESENAAPGPPDWIDMGTYWLNVHDQGTDGWKKARKGFGTRRLITMSNAAKAAGHSEYDTIEQYKKDFLNNKVIPPNVHMLRGTLDEPVARRIYEAYAGVTVLEVGLAVAKFDLRFGASVDGMVGNDGIIEIKCPVSIYPKMKPDHYDQMQGSMAVTGKKWCDYVQFVEQRDGSAIVKIERIPFDQEYWDHTLYPLLDRFLCDVGVPKLQ